MAIKKNITLKNGLEVEDAYMRIDTISGYKKSITISLNIYISKDAFMENKPYIQQNFHTFTPNVSIGAKCIWEQAYEYIKSIDEYRDSIDC